MKRIVLVVAAMAAIAVAGTEKVSAVQPAGYPFFPFGFYQPYGAQYGASLQTPPYFALNPPVYYGARHARPYGMSPFASPPVVSPAGNYRGRLATDFYVPESEMQPTAPNPCVTCSKTHRPVTKGVVRNNPFVAESKLAAQ